MGSFRDGIMEWAKRGVWTFDFPPLASFSSTSVCRLRRSRGATANRPARYTSMVQQSTVLGTHSMPRGFDEAPQYDRATVAVDTEDGVQGLACPGLVDAPAETEAGEFPPLAYYCASAPMG